MGDDMIDIKATNCNFVREPLIAPFGFKGESIEELWQIVALIESQKGSSGLGLGVQSVLWSDSRVFEEAGDLGGNNIMFLIMNYALRAAQGMSFSTPIELLDKLLPKAYEYGRRITGDDNLRETFILNALTPVDLAAWTLYFNEKGLETFDHIILPEYSDALSYRHSKLASIPLIAYGIPIKEVIEHVEAGYFLLKIKIGSDPEKDGDPDKMLEWDKNRLLEIHEAVRDYETPHTQNRKIAYYLDANGRYDSKERLMELLEYADTIGALENIIILEEPFPEDVKIDVSDVPVNVAADESAHSDRDVLERIELGYGAIALKPIAKTLSMSFKMAKIAHDHDIPCFCADLTVNPIMVDWNKNIAARLKPLPGLKIGVVETNGHQNYKNWDNMKAYHPQAGGTWTRMARGVFNIDESFYSESGGIFEMSEYYRGLV